MPINKHALPLVIGFFDGIHIGHAQLLKYEKFNILTFINVPTKNKNFLFDNCHRLSLLKQTNVNNIYILDLLKNNLSIYSFIDLLKTKIKPSLIVVGDNFKFGKNQEGNVLTLKRYFKVKNINLVENVSTTLIKSLIRNGKVEQAQKLLVTKFVINNKVVHGKKYGRKLGFPTANIFRNATVIRIKPGVYAGFTFINGKKYQSAIFISSSNQQKVESHLFKFNKNIYGKTITVMPTKFINRFRKTHNEKELKQVVSTNIVKITSFFNRHQ
jgi:riboflavin kinase/FMN adenylyltransferase